jgi:hypothetical protein
MDMVMNIMVELKDHEDLKIINCNDCEKVL